MLASILTVMLESCTWTFVEATAVTATMAADWSALKIVPRDVAGVEGSPEAWGELRHFRVRILGLEGKTDDHTLSGSWRRSQPKPSTLNPQPSTPNPKPYLNHGGAPSCRCGRIPKSKRQDHMINIAADPDSHAQGPNIVVCNRPVALRYDHGTANALAAHLGRKNLGLGFRV